MQVRQASTEDNDYNVINLLENNTFGTVKEAWHRYNKFSKIYKKTTLKLRPSFKA